MKKKKSKILKKVIKKKKDKKCSVEVKAILLLQYLLLEDKVYSICIKTVLCHLLIMKGQRHSSSTLGLKLSTSQKQTLKATQR